MAEKAGNKVLWILYRLILFTRKGFLLARRKRIRQKQQFLCLYRFLSLKTSKCNLPFGKEALKMCKKDDFSRKGKKVKMTEDLNWEKMDLLGLLDFFANI